MFINYMVTCLLDNIIFLPLIVAVMVLHTSTCALNKIGMLLLIFKTDDRDNIALR